MRDVDEDAGGLFAGVDTDAVDALEGDGDEPVVVMRLVVAF